MPTASLAAPLGVMLGLMLGPGGGCVVPQTFQCLTNADCGESGRCEDNGSCAFEDDDCASGYRYGLFANPELASECVDPAFGSGESGGETGDGDGDEGSASAGDGDGDPSGDGDGDPSGDGDGDASTDTNSGDGDGDPGPAEGLFLYTLSVANSSWTRQSLTLAYNDENAPNDVDLVAATSLEAFDHLILISADDGVYVRKSGEFDAPRELGQWTQDALPGGIVTALSHIPEAPDGCEVLVFYLHNNGATLRTDFQYCEDFDLLVFKNTTVLETSNGFPQSSQSLRFAFTNARLADFATEGWLTTYRALDTRLAAFDNGGDVAMAIESLAQNAFWGLEQGGLPLLNEPDPSAVHATYYRSSELSPFLFAIAP